jgi:YD repeat-containing protein
MNVTFTYDSISVTYGIGRLTGRTDPSGSYVFYYDAKGNLAKEEKTINSTLYTTQYTYNNNNNNHHNHRENIGKAPIKEQE